MALIHAEFTLHMQVSQMNRNTSEGRDDAEHSGQWSFEGPSISATGRLQQTTWICHRQNASPFRSLFTRSRPTYEHLTFQHQKRLPASQRIDGPAAGTITVRQQASDSLVGYAMQRPTTQSYAAAPFHATQRHPLQLVYARHAIKREVRQAQCQGRRRTSADLDTSVCANTAGLNRDIVGVRSARHNRQG